MNSRLRPIWSASFPKNSAEAGAEDVRGACGADLRGVEYKAAVALRELAADRADDRDREAVEDPHRPQADDDHPVPARPWKPVHARRYGRLDRSQRCRLASHGNPLIARSDRLSATYPSRAICHETVVLARTAQGVATRIAAASWPPR
jgi:hypothetical protein